MDNYVCSEVVNTLKENPELHRSLEAAVELEVDNEMADGWTGFQWFELPEKPQTLKMLVLKRVLRVTRKTRTTTYYRLTDAEATQEALNIITILRELHETSETYEIPEDLFDDVTRYEDVKDPRLFLLGREKLHP